MREEPLIRTRADAQREEQLRHHVKEHSDLGARQCDLGIVAMPLGYVLMDNREGHYYWLRKDGREGPLNATRWGAYHMAKANLLACTLASNPELRLGA